MDKRMGRSLERLTNIPRKMLPKVAAIKIHLDAAACSVLHKEEPCASASHTIFYHVQQGGSASWLYEAWFRGTAWQSAKKRGAVTAVGRQSSGRHAW